MVHAANQIEKEKNKEGLQHQPLLRRTKKKTIETKRQVVHHQKKIGSTGMVNLILN
jgi:hypothetical protein